MAEPEDKRDDVLSLVFRTFDEGWRNVRTGDIKSFIEGVEVLDVRVSGDSALVVSFSAAARPGVLFASRFRLYEPDGSPEDWRLIPIRLKERIEGARGLPPLRSCEPDADGIVWY